MITEASCTVERPDDGVMLIRLNRPEQRNALATHVLVEIADALKQAHSNAAIRTVVITGTDTVFAAGADLNELKHSKSTDEIESLRFKAWADIRAFVKPLIMAVEGWCLGAGLELMMCADIAIAGEGAKIGQPETNLGIIPGAGGTSVLPRLVGRSLAMKMVLTGKPISAQEAYRFGLISEAVATGMALKTALDLAGMIAKRAPLALQLAKASIKDSEWLSLEEHILAERRRFVDLMGSKDKEEGVTAFLEKRKPSWRGE